MKKRIYLDHASTTPLDKRVFKAMLPFMKNNFGNPSALYKEGVLTKRAIIEARTTIARQLNIKPEEIIFTASGTEADNLALIGIFNAHKKSFFEKNKKPHIIATVIEHPGILEACKYIEQEGGEVTYIPIEENGIVDVHKIKAALKPETILVSLMYANNEIGTIQPIHEISRIIQEFQKNNLPYFHTDASQAGNYLSLNFQKLGVDMMTLDASKIYGPKGVGLLAVKRNVKISPIIFGGGQENNKRSGTENTPQIIGMAKAMEITESMREKESDRLQKLQKYFFEEVTKFIPNVIINGDRTKRLPNNVNICIPGLDAEFAVLRLDAKEIACSSASSCLNLSENSYSYVINSLGVQGPKCKESSLRFTLGRGTTKKELYLTLKEIKNIIITQ